MHPEALDFLKQLLHTPGPSGDEAKIQQVVRDYVEKFRAKGFIEALPIPSEAPEK